MLATQSTIDRCSWDRAYQDCLGFHTDEWELQQERGRGGGESSGQTQSFYAMPAAYPQRLFLFYLETVKHVVRQRRTPVMNSGILW